MGEIKKRLRRRRKEGDQSQSVQVEAILSYFLIYLWFHSFLFNLIVKDSQAMSIARPIKNHWTA